MNIKELYGYFDEKIPKTLSCEWDNDGLLCCPDPKREVGRVLICLDVTDAVVDKAEAEGFDVIISHHPLIFKGLKALSGETGADRRIMRLIKSGISLMSFHTRFDAVDGGVNDTLASIFELENVEKVDCDGSPLARKGNLKFEMTLEEFAALAKEKLGAPHVSFGRCSGKVYSVGIIGGGGGDFTSDMARAGADTFLSGDIGYHTLTDADAMGINLVQAGHYYTEQPACESFARIVSGADESIYTEIFESNTIFDI